MPYWICYHTGKLFRLASVRFHGLSYEENVCLPSGFAVLSHWETFVSTHQERPFICFRIVRSQFSILCHRDTKLNRSTRRMKHYLEKDAWKIIERGFHPEHNKITESILSIGNGYMGQRANFAESYSGDSMQGSYLAGVYYPDKTRVGWWKNGYPEYFAKVINSVNWIGIDIYLNGMKLDLATVEFLDFSRTLDMRLGLLQKRLKIKTREGHILNISSERFCSWTTKELGVISYKLSSENYSGKLNLFSYLDFDVRNQDSNYDEQFWKHQAEGLYKGFPFVEAETKKTGFYVNASMVNSLTTGNASHTAHYQAEMKVVEEFAFDLKAGDEISLTKCVAISSSLNHQPAELRAVAKKLLSAANTKGYTSLRAEQIKAWADIWTESDIVIEGDVAAQQGIRFNIFQLKQTYSGHDARLNIGPKGFTGEKYGGVTYWDTEAYCIPFYLSTARPEVAYNLLKYRYNHLDKAIENAAKLGFTKGAALYPMVTMNGEECHNEWEITFEEIHRNGAIAYAIHDYTRYTGDQTYVEDYGIEVLIAIARFWSQRVNWSEDKQQYVMLGVTGPNEYENNVHNNWYTNYIASWCLRYALKIIEQVKQKKAAHYATLVSKLAFDEAAELKQWKDITQKMYYPYDAERNVFLQQDGFLDKELTPANAIPEGEYPIHQHWSWDRILRSCYIKQADVLQGLYFFEEDFDQETIKRNFYFYEPMTVHESSLSPCVHTILAAKIGDHDKAYEMYLRTARLDLDDYNNDTKDGLHITSMGGTWMSVIKGIAGMRINNDMLSFAPFLPPQWTGYSFKIRYRANVLEVKVTTEKTTINNIAGGALSILFNGEEHHLKSGIQDMASQDNIAIII